MSSFVLRKIQSLQATKQNTSRCGKVFLESWRKNFTSRGKKPNKSCGKVTAFQKWADWVPLRIIQLPKLRRIKYLITLRDSFRGPRLWAPPSMEPNQIYGSDLHLWNLLAPPRAAPPSLPAHPPSPPPSL